MKNCIPLSIAAGALVLVAGCAEPVGSPTADAWSCTADGLRTARYSGGATAYVHLAGYSEGQDYPVTLSADGRTATGVTGNGTQFTCVQAN